jgi:hypothetical protein
MKKNAKIYVSATNNGGSKVSKGTGTIYNLHSSLTGFPNNIVIAVNNNQCGIQYAITILVWNPVQGTRRLKIVRHPIRIGWQQHDLDWITVYTENWVYRHEFSFTRLIVEDMLFHWNLLQGCTHQSLWLESPKAQCSTFQSWDWWCTKGKVKVNRFFLEARADLYVTFRTTLEGYSSGYRTLFTCARH